MGIGVYVKAFAMTDLTQPWPEDLSKALKKKADLAAEMFVTARRQEKRLAQWKMVAEALMDGETVLVLDRDGSSRTWKPSQVQEWLNKRGRP